LVTGSCTVPSVNVASVAGTTERRVPNSPVETATQVGAPVRSSVKKCSTVPIFSPSGP
jgi:hypothetical protein